MRWWDGYRWTDQTAGAPFPQPNKGQVRLGVGLGVGTALLIGGFLAGFTNVSLLTGTSQVWLGVALTIAAAITSIAVGPVDLWLKIVAPIIAAACIAGGIYDEVQLQHKRDELTHLLDDFPGSSSGKELSHTAVERYIQDNLGASDVSCNDNFDMPLDRDGETYECLGSGDRTFTVTITDASKGNYEVR